MIACGTATFTDPDEYRARFPRATMHLVLTGRGDFKARLTWANLRRLSFIRVEESLPRVAFLSLAPGPIFIAFPIRNHLSPLWNGQELGRGTILLHSNQGDRIYQRTEGLCHWGMISLAPKDLAAYARAVAHVDLDLPPTPELLRPPLVAATKLRRLHAQACRLAETKPDIVAHKQVARALEEDFLYALINCVLGVERRRDRPQPQHYSVIMARFEDVLASHGHRHLSAPELCAAVGLPERTLRTCCANFLRMSPLTYSRLRRLNPRALRAAAD
jgi:AraC-like DNA-binding protein